MSTGSAVLWDTVVVVGRTFPRCCCCCCVRSSRILASTLVRAKVNIRCASVYVVKKYPVTLASSPTTMNGTPSASTMVNVGTGCKIRAISDAERVVDDDGSSPLVTPTTDWGNDDRIVVVDVRIPNILPGIRHKQSRRVTSSSLVTPSRDTQRGGCGCCEVVVVGGGRNANTGTTDTTNQPISIINGVIIIVMIYIYTCGDAVREDADGHGCLGDTVRICMVRIVGKNEVERRFSLGRACRSTRMGLFWSDVIRRTHTHTLRPTLGQTRDLDSVFMVEVLSHHNIR